MTKNSQQSSFKIETPNKVRVFIGGPFSNLADFMEDVAYLIEHDKRFFWYSAVFLKDNQSSNKDANDRSLAEVDKADICCFFISNTLGSETHKITKKEIERAVKGKKALFFFIGDEYTQDVMKGITQNREVSSWKIDYEKEHGNFPVVSGHKKDAKNEEFKDKFHASLNDLANEITKPSEIDSDKKLSNFVNNFNDHNIFIKEILYFLNFLENEDMSWTRTKGDSLKFLRKISHAESTHFVQESLNNIYINSYAYAYSHIKKALDLVSSNHSVRVIYLLLMLKMYEISSTHSQDIESELSDALKLFDASSAYDAKLKSISSLMAAKFFRLKKLKFKDAYSLSFEDDFKDVIIRLEDSIQYRSDNSYAYLELIRCLVMHGSKDISKMAGYSYAATNANLEINNVIRFEDFYFLQDEISKDELKEIIETIKLASNSAVANYLKQAKDFVMKHGSIIDKVNVIGNFSKSDYICGRLIDSSTDEYLKRLDENIDNIISSNVCDNSASICSDFSNSRYSPCLSRNVFLYRDNAIYVIAFSLMLFAFIKDPIVGHYNEFLFFILFFIFIFYFYLKTYLIKANAATNAMSYILKIKCGGYFHDLKYVDRRINKKYKFLDSLDSEQVKNYDKLERSCDKSSVVCIKNNSNYFISDVFLEKYIKRSFKEKIFKPKYFRLFFQLIFMLIAFLFFVSDFIIPK